MDPGANPGASTIFKEMDMKKNIFIISILFIFISTFLYTNNTEKDKEKIKIINSQIQHLQSKIPLTKQPLELYLKIAYLYTEINELDNAILYYNKALELDNKNANIYYMLAMIYEKRKNYTMAIDNWQKCLIYTKNQKIKQIAQKHIEYLTKLK